MTFNLQSLIIALMAAMVRAAPTDDHEGPVSSPNDDAAAHIDIRRCDLLYGDNPRKLNECYNSNI